MARDASAQRKHPPRVRGKREQRIGRVWRAVGLRRRWVRVRRPRTGCTARRQRQRDAQRRQAGDRSHTRHAKLYLLSGCRAARLWHPSTGVQTMALPFRLHMRMLCLPCMHGVRHSHGVHLPALLSRRRARTMRAARSSLSLALASLTWARHAVPLARGGASAATFRWICARSTTTRHQQAWRSRWRCSL